MNPALDTRRIAAFLATSVLLVSLFAVGWPVIRAPYGQGFRAAGNALFGSLGAERVVRFRSSREGKHRDVRIVLLSDGVRRPTDLELSSERTGYRPSAVVLALFLATPGPARSWWRMLGGILAVQALVAARVLLVLLQAYASWMLDGRPVLDVGVPLAVVDALVLWTFQETTANYLVPLLVWACLALRTDTFAPPREPAGSGSP